MTFVVAVSTTQSRDAEVVFSVDTIIFFFMPFTGTTSPVTNGCTSTQTVWDIWFYSL